MTMKFLWQPLIGHVVRMGESSVVSTLTASSGHTQDPELNNSVQRLKVGGGLDSKALRG